MAANMFARSAPPFAIAFLLAGGGHAAEPNPLQLSPDHATASVASLDKETEWYERVLGFKETGRVQPNPGFEVRHLAIPGYRIDLVGQKGSVRQHAVTGAYNQGWYHVVFKTPNIDKAFGWLQMMGTDVKANRNAQAAITRLVLHDPEGNELEIVVP
jgi:catechol 2,3-dioxygenase-like lactoylglutathione lyase family enzyme